MLLEVDVEAPRTHGPDTMKLSSFGIPSSGRLTILEISCLGSHRLSWTQKDSIVGHITTRTRQLCFLISSVLPAGC